MLWLVEVGPKDPPKLKFGADPKPTPSLAYAICTTQPKSTDFLSSFPFPAVSCPQNKLILPSPPSDTSRTTILANDLPHQSRRLFSVTQWQRLFVRFLSQKHMVFFQHDDSDDRWMIATFEPQERYEIVSSRSRLTSRCG